MTHKYNWMDPEDAEVKSCSICNEEIYGMGNNPQPVILNGKKLEVADSCCSNCNDNVVIPTRVQNINNRKDLH
jgi:hypothetical protein|tara:strand:- start:925 stop:1143 length:219 start_codon:yes stop_codon:yes gene_type:complete